MNPADQRPGTTRGPTTRDLGATGDLTKRNSFLHYTIWRSLGLVSPIRLSSAWPFRTCRGSFREPTHAGGQSSNRQRRKLIRCLGKILGTNLYWSGKFDDPRLTKKVERMMAEVKRSIERGNCALYFRSSKPIRPIAEHLKASGWRRRRKTSGRRVIVENSWGRDRHRRGP